MKHKYQRITSEKNLFLDELMIGSTKGVKRTLHQPVKHPANPVVKPHADWIKMALVFGSVIREGNHWKMWYYAKTDFGPAVCYAESTDGINWRQPDLPLVNYRGKATNVIITPKLIPDYGEIFGVIHNPGAKDRQEKYLALYVKLLKEEPKVPFCGSPYHPKIFRRPKWYFKDSRHPGLYAAFSPDGIRWRTSDQPLFDYPADISYLLYDTRRKRYAVYGRMLNQKFFRTVQHLESAELVFWIPRRPKKVFAPDRKDPKGTEVYSMTVMNYGNQYVGFPQIYHKPSGTLQIQLATSRDGIDWTRVAERKVWLPEGGAGDWDRFNISLASAPVMTDKELWFYYGGRTYRHPGHSYQGKDNGPVWGAVGLAVLRLDGFVSMDAGFEPGEIMTVPLVLSGEELHVNVRSPFGKLTVELLDFKTGRILVTSDSLTTDSVDAPVTWNGKPQIPIKRRAVSIRFSLVNANLFSYWSLSPK